MGKEVGERKAQTEIRRFRKKICFLLRESLFYNALIEKMKDWVYQTTLKG